MPKVRYFKHDGLSLTVKQASEKYKLSVRLIQNRLCMGWSIRRILTTPKLKYATIVYPELAGCVLSRKLQEGFAWDEVSVV